MAILKAHYETLNSESPDPTSYSATAMDPNTRPIALTITDWLKALARDFKLWSRSNWGTKKRREVGPSGFEDKSMTNEQEVDPIHKQLSNEIEEDAEHYQVYEQMSYGDDGDTPGLLTRCVNSRILLNSSRKDKETLAKKLYLYEVKKDREAALNFGPARKVPDRINSTGLTLYDLLCGVERFVIVQGHLLTRMRPKDVVIDEKEGHHVENENHDLRADEARKDARAE